MAHKAFYVGAIFDSEHYSTMKIIVEVCNFKIFAAITQNPCLEMLQKLSSILCINA